ncbi:MAG TPA: glycosyltransferase family 4 protein [Solirubrobacteraceae bacterium]|nr:glycosyltransferase family 4 protein [Solirubrobacteraceae bacterium]
MSYRPRLEAHTLSGQLTVHHFGPDPRSIGGMASVIGVHVEHRVGADEVFAHPTWRPGSSLATAMLAASSTAALLRLPSGVVAHVHLSEGGSFVREGLLLSIARRRGLVTAATIHGANFKQFAVAHPRLVSSVLGWADIVTCLDAETLGLVEASAPGAHAVMLFNPVAVESDYTTADRTEELVLFAGEVSLRKGADVLVRAWPEVLGRRPRARCVLVGPAGDFTAPSVERLEVLPARAPAEVARLMRTARVIALPARAEAMPMTLLEAMSLARPFVSTPVGEIPALAEAGGALVPVGDETALAERLAELLADGEAARVLGEGGRRFCLANCSVERIDARLRELYAEALAARACGRRP